MRTTPPLDSTRADRLLPRRGFLRIVGLAVATGAVVRGGTVDTPTSAVPRYRVAVCDWMILKRQKLGGIALARELGCDGLEIDMGSLGTRETFDNKLADPAQRQVFIDDARARGIAFSSVALSGFYAQSFAARANFEALVQSAIDTALALETRTLFLPLGVQGDLTTFPERRPDVVERLRLVGARAAAAGVVIGVETALDARGEAALLDEIASPAVKSYFNFANALSNGRDVAAELTLLGADRLAQIHCTNKDGVWLENDPQVNLPAIKATLDRLGWAGWLVLERSRDTTDVHNVKRNYGANAAYVRRVFQ